MSAVIVSGRSFVMRVLSGATTHSARETTDALFWRSKSFKSYSRGMLYLSFLKHRLDKYGGKSSVLIAVIPTKPSEC